MSPIASSSSNPQLTLTKEIESKKSRVPPPKKKKCLEIRRKTTSHSTTTRVSSPAWALTRRNSLVWALWTRMPSATCHAYWRSTGPSIAWETWWVGRTTVRSWGGSIGLYWFGCFWWCIAGWVSWWFAYFACWFDCFGCVVWFGGLPWLFLHRFACCWDDFEGWPMGTGHLATRRGCMTCGFCCQRGQKPVFFQLMFV